MQPMRMHFRGDRKRCPRCRYFFDETPVDECPECGKNIRRATDMRAEAI